MRIGDSGRPPLVPRRTRSRQPVDVKTLAMSLPASAYQKISWWEGTNASLSGRFAAVRVRHAGGNSGRARLRPEQWLLIEWPAGDADPLKYYLSTLPAETPLNDLVAMAHRRWRIERDYQDLKQEFGLDHHEGRGWRGFHHHAALSIAAYGFLMSERLNSGSSSKKTSSSAKFLRFPEIPSREVVRRTQRHVVDSLATLRHELSVRLLERMPRCPCCGRLT